MPEKDDAAERSHEPTPKRKEQAKKKGQVPRSRELNTMMLLIVGSGMLMVTGGSLFNTLMTVMKTSFTIKPADLLSTDIIFNRIATIASDVLINLFPIFVVLLVVTLLSPALLGGWNFSAESLQFKGERISPLKGIKRMFSVRALVELAKALAKFFLILAIGLLVLWQFFSSILHLTQLPVRHAIPEGLIIVGIAFIMISIALIVISAADVPFQLWDHNKKLKMTHQEVKEERKESEGSPEMRQRIRSAQTAIAQQRLVVAVPNADIVITNPTHYAVALRYDDNSDAAPILVAKGRGWVAEQIKTLAEKHQVNTISAPPLARSLYANAEVNQEIPQGLYVAVAKLLAHLYQLRRFHAGAAGRPEPLGELPIPDELQVMEEV